MNFDPAPFLFLRPMWLLLLAIIPVIAWLMLRSARAPSVWTQYVDPHLQDALLEKPKATRGIAAVVWMSCLLAVTIVALAGPSFRQSEQPLWERGGVIVVAAEMSSDVLSNDIQPSRLLVMHQKMAAVMSKWEGTLGFIAYTEQPFTVTPMTEDARNASVFLDQLSPEVMPRNGKNPAAAIDYAVDLMRRDGQSSGVIWLLATDADDAAVSAARRARAQGFVVSVSGVGANGSINTSAMEAVANAGGGTYATVTANDSDLKQLALDTTASAKSNSRMLNIRNGFVRQDNGFWLIPIILLLGLFAFRRRQAAAMVLVFALIPMFAPSTALAQGVPSATAWRTQQQQNAIQAQKADAAYKAGDYETAAQLYEPLVTPQHRYNYANSLAKMGKYSEAIKAYDQAIAGNPKNTDAKINKALVEAALKSQVNSFNKPAEKPSTKQGQKSSEEELRKQQEAQQRKRDQERKAREELERQRREAQKKDAEKKKDEINPLTGKPYTPDEKVARGKLNEDLRKVEDDPGGLLRAKFYLEYIRRLSQQGGTP